jgi:hypothetical protein
MKKLIAIAALALLAVMGAPLARANPDSDYCAFLSSQHVGERSQLHPTCSQLTQLGRTICSDFDRGLTGEQEYDALMKADITVKDAAALMAGATHFYCPSHESELR